MLCCPHAEARGVCYVDRPPRLSVARALSPLGRRSDTAYLREGCRASSRLRVREEWEWGVEVGENARAASEQERGGRARSSCLVRDRMQLARADAAANDAHFPAKQLSERKAFEC